MYESAQKKRILVVEDEPMIRQVLCILLKHRNFDVLGVSSGQEAMLDFDVLGVSSGQEAMLAIPEFNPHLIILDLLMHPISGWDVLHWLRTNHLTPHIPVLVASALVQQTEQMHGFEEGAIEYVPKPTQPSIIVERVQALLSMNAKQRSMLHRRRIDEQRKTLARLSAAQSDEFVY